MVLSGWIVFLSLEFKFISNERALDADLVQCNLSCIQLLFFFVIMHSPNPTYYSEVTHSIKCIV